jgi:ABC-type uncharacterized transport system permease subunit
LNLVSAVLDWKAQRLAIDSGGTSRYKEASILDQRPSPKPMPASLIAPLCALLYLSACGLQVLHIFQRGQSLARGVLPISLIALALHALIAWNSVFQANGISLGFFKISALIFLVINIACIGSLARRPLQNLLVLLFPLSALSVLVTTFAPDTTSLTPDFSGGMLLHIGSSIFAYAVLTIAAAQAALLALQDHQLKKRQTRGIVQILPPLQLMESMLFELLWFGVALLTLAIASGFIFVEDIFAQHLAHKTILTILAWILFSSLLWGHYQLGWRSHTAVRLTLAGFAVLMLAFFGSKLVLELVLHRA